jgi:antitoxin component YwqK of YwqJK toxin-antitoxin module
MIKFPYLLSLSHNTKGIVISIVPCLKENLKSERNYNDGKWTKWYENGQLKK